MTDPMQSLLESMIAQTQSINHDASTMLEASMQRQLDQLAEQQSQIKDLQMPRKKPKNKPQTPNAKDAIYSINTQIEFDGSTGELTISQDVEEGDELFSRTVMTAYGVDQEVFDSTTTIPSSEQVMLGRVDGLRLKDVFKNWRQQVKALEKFNLHWEREAEKAERQ